MQEEAKENGDSHHRREGHHPVPGKFTQDQICSTKQSWAAWDNTLRLEGGRQVVAFGVLLGDYRLTEVSPKLSMEFTTLLPSASRVLGLQAMTPGLAPRLFDIFLLRSFN